MQLSTECKTNPVANQTQCCDRLVQEVTDACLSYREAVGLTVVTCRGWTLETNLACTKYCGHCNKTSETLFEICKFALAVLGDGALIIKMCKETQDIYKKYRCPSACEVPQHICYDKIADSCSEECGNFMPCHCRHRFMTLFDSECLGTPVRYDVPVPNKTWLNYTCDMTPKACQHHRPEGQKCAKHRWCPPNLCIINNVKCVSPHPCLDDGICKPDEGLCFFANRPDGYPCTDHVDYTVEDRCMNGNCFGTPDYCLKYNVTCKPQSDCLKGGFCHSDSGRCTYDILPDDDYCDDGRDYTVEDRCTNGFCVGRAVDLCSETGIECRTPNSCTIAGTCDSYTGECSLPIPLSNRTCDDGDPTTSNDTCIDGLCLGYPADIEFLTLGEGECTDRSALRMPRYIGDTSTEEECEDVCLNDPQCRAFNYAYPSCSIWGTVRFRAPTDDREWAYMGGSVPMAAVLIEIATSVAQGQRAGVCRLKGEKSNEILPMSDEKVDANVIFNTRVMLIFFLCILFCFCILPLGKCMRTVFFGPSVPKTMPEGSMGEQHPTGTGEASLRLASTAFDDLPALPPLSPAHGGVSAVAALSDGNPNAASPGAESTFSNESDGDVLMQLPAALPPDPEEPAPPECPAPVLEQGEEEVEEASTQKKWQRKKKNPTGMEPKA